MFIYAFGTAVKRFLKKQYFYLQVGDYKRAHIHHGCVLSEALKHNYPHFCNVAQTWELFPLGFLKAVSVVLKFHISNIVSR